MQRMLLALVLVAAAAWAQEPATENSESATEETATEETAAEVEELPADAVTDEEVEALLGLDEPYPEDDDDEFIPSEEVKFEQSIPFPTDI